MARIRAEGTIGTCGAAKAAEFTVETMACGSRGKHYDHLSQELDGWYYCALLSTLYRPQRATKSHSLRHEKLVIVIVIPQTATIVYLFFTLLQTVSTAIQANERRHKHCLLPRHTACSNHVAVNSGDFTKSPHMQLVHMFLMHS